VDERPVTCHATAPDGVRIAYQVAGHGTVDVVVAVSGSTPIDLPWDEPSFVQFAKRLRLFSRTIWYDPRGLGASGGDYLDHVVSDIGDADLTAVLDSVDSESAVLCGFGNAGPHFIRYSALFPERVRALVLQNTFAHYVREIDYPCGVPLDALTGFAARLGEVWGTHEDLAIVVAPSKASDEAFLAWWARCQRLGVRPDQTVVTLPAAFGQDVRPLLPTLSLPTLILHREGSRWIRVEAGRYLAEHIPGAKYVELPGEDALFFIGDTEAMLDEIEEFLTGAHQPPEGDVSLTTILFTDIVGSTEQAARMGHRRWTTLTDEHNTRVRATLARHRGYEVKTTGDGFLATFDATTRAVRAAQEIVTSASNMGLQVRAGIHVGEVEVRPDDVVGLPVSIAKRICDLGGPGEVFVSSGVRELLIGSGVEWSDRGEHELKGVPGTWRLFAVRG
jgi:class 3 adenylate cyclase